MFISPARRHRRRPLGPERRHAWPPLHPRRLALAPRLPRSQCRTPTLQCYRSVGTKRKPFFGFLYSSVDALVAAHQSVPVALVGDFNCALSRIPAVSRPVNWTHLKGVSPLNGQMQGLIDDRDLTVAEFCYPQEISHSYERGEHRTHIDHIAVSQSLKTIMARCRILPPSVENLSPHLPIVASFIIPVRGDAQHVNSSDTPTPRPDRLRWNSGERNEAYQYLLSLRLSTAPERLKDNADCLDELADFITSSIHVAAKDSGVARPSRPPKPWWSPSISAARDRCRLWHRIWVDCGRPYKGYVYDCFHRARRAYRRARKVAARSQIDQEARLLHTLRLGNVKPFWKHVGRVRRDRQPSQCALSAEHFRAHFSDIHDDSEGRLSPF